MNSALVLAFLVVSCVASALAGAYFTTDKESSTFYSWRPLQKSEQCRGVSAFQNITTKGISMLPTIKEGDILLVVPFNESRPVVTGDLVVFNNASGESPVLHRVYGVYKDYFTTFGDNNAVPDGGKKVYSHITLVVCGVLF